jgi:putative phage-type endonuclease
VTEVVTPSGVLLERPLVPGSAEWLQRMSASKIAAVVGLSPYESRYSLWMRMTGLVPQQEQTSAMSRGHYLEPAIAAWFADQHPDWTITPTGTFQHPRESWMVASPDRLAVHPSGHVELVQCKSAADSTEWGPDGSDEIPPGYDAQVQWEMLVTGLLRCHVAVITAYLEFREYVIDFDPAKADFLRGEAAEFMASVAEGRRPDLDSHKQTYEAVMLLHPQIRPEQVEVPPHVGEMYVEALAAFAEAEAQKRFASSMLANYMGEAQTAFHLGRPIARRQARKDGTPYVCAVRGAVKESAA